MIIRLGQSTDIDEIADIYQDSIGTLCKQDYTVEVITLWQSSTPKEARLKLIEAGSLYVADYNGRIGGYLVAVPGEIIALFVGSAYAGLGMGKKLALHGIEIAQQTPSGKITLESTLTAAGFYQKLGFKTVGRGYFSHGTSELKIPVVNMVMD